MIKRWLMIACLLGTPSVVAAQPNTRPVVSFTIGIVDAAGYLVNETTYQNVNIECDHTETFATPPLVVNPISLYFLNPMDPTRRCKIDNSLQILALPEGTGYTSIVRSNTANESTGWSDPSNQWNRFRNSSLPLPSILKGILQL